MEPDLLIERGDLLRGVQSRGFLSLRLQGKMAIDLSMCGRDMGMVRGDTPGGRWLRVSHTVCRSVETDLRYHRNRSKLALRDFCDTMMQFSARATV